MLWFGKKKLLTPLNRKAFLTGRFFVSKYLLRLFKKLFLCYASAYDEYCYIFNNFFWFRGNLSWQNIWENLTLIYHIIYSLYSYLLFQRLYERKQESFYDDESYVFCIRRLYRRWSLDVKEQIWWAPKSSGNSGTCFTSHSKSKTSGLIQ